jgi:hypothetical protein
MSLFDGEPEASKTLRAPSFRFFLAKGWETSNLNRAYSSGARNEPL